MMHRGNDDELDRTELLATRGPRPAPGEGEAAALPPGARIGRYRIVGLLGRGGMGEVYRAEQLEPVRRTVALKLLRGRRLDARRLAAFEVERQVLAQMRHPAIAQVYDADTTPAGQPWFAMEFIAGSTLTAYCEERGLSLEDRLRLFIGACEGVQHAHQKGVVHRDLKPGNLLVDEVDGRPLPKVIDFGIARAAGEGDGEVAGTPDYMSPEQAAGDAALVDTRSDVWSLGVVLSELLTGQRPAVGPGTAAGTVAAPTLPSRRLQTLSPEEGRRVAAGRGVTATRLRRVLRHELDWVVARAMAHDRAERYQSAAALADDLRRFLEGRPLAAVPATRRYVAGKFARRHRAGIAAAAVAVAALLGGLALSLHGLMEARVQRAIAEERSAQLEAVADFQQSMLENVDVEAMGAALAASLREQVGRAGEAPAAALDAALFHASLPDVARGLLDRNLLGEADAAIGRDFAGQPLLAADLVESLGDVRAALGLHAQAAADHARVAALREAELGPRDPGALDARRRQAAALLEAGDVDAARAVVDAAVVHAAHLDPDGELRLRLEQLEASVMSAAGDRPGAARRLQALHARAAAAHGEESDVATAILSGLAILQSRTGDAEAGREAMERLLRIQERIHGPEAQATIDALHNLAPMRAMTGDAEGAIEVQRRVIALRSRRSGAEHPDTLGARANLGAFLIDAGRIDEALEAGVDVVAAMDRVLGPAHRLTLRARLNLATAYARAERYDEALVLQAEVLDARTRLLGAGHPDTLFIAINRAGTLLQAGRPEDSVARLEALLPLARETLGMRHPQAQMALLILGDAQRGLGRPDEAVRAYAALLEARRGALGNGHHQTIAAAARLADALDGAGRGGEAAALRAELVAPLLAADLETLDPPARALAESLRGGADS